MARLPGQPLTGLGDNMTTKKLNMWIGGETHATENYFDVLNPVDDSLYATAAHGAPADVEKAVATAKEAFKTFRKTLPAQREAWLIKAADIIQRREQEFVDILIDEVGSPIMKAKFEVIYAVNFLRAAAGMCRRIKGETMPTDMPGRISMSTRAPIGVVGIITPFNVPLIKGAKLAATPLATGNTVVALPSELTPSVQLLLGEVFEEAGFPKGVYNVVTGFGHEIGDSLTGHDDVKAVMFTGSSRVGQHIAQICGKQMKRVLLELGGKSPLVVLEDADLDAAAHAAAMACYFFQGQGCMVASRVLVQESIMDSFLEKLKEKAATFQGGDLRDPKTMIGPIISGRQRDRVRDHIEQARDKGATVLAGGNWHGFQPEATILTGVTEEMTVCREETFGPVNSVYPVKDLQHALEVANDTEFGLSAAIFTNDINSALTYVQDVEAGMVHINAPTFADEPHVPFGGVGNSGMGREGTEADMELLTELKWVTVQLPVDGVVFGPSAK